MKQLFSMLEEVAKRHNLESPGNRQELLMDAPVNNSDAVFYNFESMSKLNRIVAFSAHLDNVFGSYSNFFRHDGKFHGTLDNAAGVALLLCLKDELKTGKFTPRNHIQLIFTKQEEPTGDYDAFRSAWQMRDYLVAPDLMAVVDIRPRNKSSKDVVIENCFPEKMLKIAASLAGKNTEISQKRDLDEAVAYTNNFRDERFPVISVGPVVHPSGLSKKEIENTMWWHNPTGVFATEKSMVDAYKLIKRIADLKLP